MVKQVVTGELTIIIMSYGLGATSDRISTENWRFCSNAVGLTENFR